MSNHQQVINKRVINTRKIGEGPLLVMGHCLMGSMAVDDETRLFDWDKVAEHCSLLRYDALGHGESEGSPEIEDYRWPNLANTMLQLAAKNGNQPSNVNTPQKAFLGGISMGCATALQAAVNDPAAVQGLILVLPPTAWRSRPKQAKFYRRFAGLASLLGTVPFKLLDMLPIDRLGDGSNKKSLMALSVMKRLKHAEIAFLTATLKGAAMSDLPDMQLLKSLDIPTAIFAWSEDDSHPESTAILLRQLLPNVQFFDIAQADKLDHWTDNLISFVQSQSS